MTISGCRERTVAYITKLLLFENSVISFKFCNRRTGWTNSTTGTVCNSVDFNLI
jgi:hypothetical protein